MTTVRVGAKSRHYAHVLDIQIPGPEDRHGVDPSPDAIGGYYGIGWYSYFRDRNTGEIYKVHESDGVNGGKGAYRDTGEKWRHDIYHNVLIPRFRKVAADDGTEITISRNERVAIQGFIHAVLLESEKGNADGKQSDAGLEGGLVGHYHGIPVMCDVNQDEVLAPPQ